MASVRPLDRRGPAEAGPSEPTSFRKDQMSQREATAPGPETSSSPDLRDATAPGLQLDAEALAATLQHYRRYGCMKCRNRVVESHLRLLGHIARRYVRFGRSFDDLLAEGVLALIRAIDSFDVHRGVPFAAFATISVDHALRGAAREPGLIRVPRRALGKGGGPGVDGSATPARVRGPGSSRAFELPPPRVALGSGPAGLDERSALVEVLADAAPTPDQLAESAEAMRTMERGLAGLEPLVAQVVRLRFGMNGGSPRAIGQIGRELRISAFAVERMLDRGLRELRSSLVPLTSREVAPRTGATARTPGI